MTMLEYVIENLLNTKGSWPQISNETDVPLSTLKKIARREVTNPGIQHVQTLHDYFQMREVTA